MYKFLIAFIVAFAATSVNGQKVSLGRCSSSLKAMANFNTTAYMGVWNEIKKYPTSMEVGQCITAQYTLSEDETYVNVVNTQVFLSVPSSIKGTAVVASDDGSAELSVTFRFGLISQSQPLWVLLTDYEDFSLTYSCVDFGLLKSEYVWILSRTKQLSLSAMNAIDAFNKENNNIVTNAYLADTDHSTLACWTFNREADN